MFKLKSANLYFDFTTNSGNYTVKNGTKIKVQVKESAVNKGIQEGVVTKVLSNMIILDGIIHIYTNEILEFEIL